MKNQINFDNEYYDAVINDLEKKIEGYKQKKKVMSDAGFRMHNPTRLKYINQRLHQLLKEVRTTEDTGYKMWLEEQIYITNKSKKKIIQSLKYKYNKAMENLMIS